MKIDVVARPCGLALGILACSACVLNGPLGTLDTDTDTNTDTAASASGAATAGPGSGGSGEETSAAETGDDGIDPGPPPVGPAKIDILFVFDNSGSMGEEQAALATSIDSMVAALEQVEAISYRVGVTTTDMGNPYCVASSPEVGALQLSSCRERVGEFLFNGVPPADATSVACTDICTLDEIPMTATPTAEDPTARVRPWIEGGVGGSNLAGVSVADALRCAMPQGIAGCGFEQPLAAAKRAIERSSVPGDPQYGFMRADAHLAIVLVTDETDCSYDDPAIFEPLANGGNQVFWGELDESPRSAVCWRAGVECSGGPGTYDECHSQNYDVNGTPGVADGLAVLRPVDGYSDFFAGLLADKRSAADASVFMFGVVGVPPGYPAAPLVYADADDEGLQSDFGIGYACSSGFGGAIPSVRERELIESFRYEGMLSNLYSICQPPLSDVYGQMIAQLAPFLGG